MGWKRSWGGVGDENIHFGGLKVKESLWFQIGGEMVGNEGMVKIGGKMGEKW